MTKRRGSIIVSLLPQILLLVAIGAGIILAVQNGTPVILAETILKTLTAPIKLLITQTFAIIAPLTPILAATIPLYLTYTKNPDPPIKTLSISAAYGVGLYILTLAAGIDTKIMALIQTSWSGSIINTTIGLASTIGATITGTLTAIAYWTTGLVIELSIKAIKKLKGGTQ